VLGSGELDPSSSSVSLHWLLVQSKVKLVFLFAADFFFEFFFGWPLLFVTAGLEAVEWLLLVREFDFFDDQVEAICVGYFNDQDCLELDGARARRISVVSLGALRWIGGMLTGLEEGIQG
jgi:hypothetical protein